MLFCCAAILLFALYHVVPIHGVSYWFNTPVCAAAHPPCPLVRPTLVTGLGPASLAHSGSRSWLLLVQPLLVAGPEPRWYGPLLSRPP